MSDVLLTAEQGAEAVRLLTMIRSMLQEDGGLPLRYHGKDMIARINNLIGDPTRGARTSASPK